MKSIVLVLMFCMLSFVSFSQKIKENDVPQVVKDALAKKFPKATAVAWEKEKGNYEANYQMAEVEQSVLITPKGKIVEAETQIKVKELPENVTSYIEKHYPGQKIKEAARIVDSKGKVTLEAEVKGMDFIFDTNGKFLKSVKD